MGPNTIPENLKANALLLIQQYSLEAFQQLSRGGNSLAMKVKSSGREEHLISGKLMFSDMLVSDAFYQSV